MQSDRPFQIRIDQAGFALPLRDPLKIRIQRGTLSLGNVSAHSATKASCPKSSACSHPAPESISVSFTPLYFSMDHGELHLARIDMLISNQFPIAAWGTLNFPSDRIRMKIGLSGDALSRAFNVPVDSEYMLQLPLKGRIASLHLDKSKATAKIGALVGYSQKSTQGSILGTVLDLASGGLTESAPPPPTTNPLPWEKEPRKKEAKSNPINSLINNLIR